jgi:hypothetical protein
MLIDQTHPGLTALFGKMRSCSRLSRRPPILVVGIPTRCHREYAARLLSFHGEQRREGLRPNSDK